MTTAVGPVTTAAPEAEPRHVLASHGHLWQWVGDGRELISLSVTVRRTRLGTPAGVRHHLTWEAQQVRETLEAGTGPGRATDVLVDVVGASTSAAADVDGRMQGLDVHNRLVVTTDGQYMHVVRILVPDSNAGRELSETISSALRVQSVGPA